MSWVTVKRSSSADNDRPIVTYRSGGRGEIGLSASFIRKASAKDARFVSFQIYTDDSKLAISFIQLQPGEPIPDHAYKLSLDNHDKEKVDSRIVKNDSRIVVAPGLKKVLV